MIVVGIIIIFFIFLTILLVLGIGTGFILSWMISDMTFGTGVLTGVVAVGSVFYFMLQFMILSDTKSTKMTAEEIAEAAESLPNWPRKRRKRRSAWKEDEQ